MCCLPQVLFSSCHDFLLFGNRKQPPCGPSHSTGNRRKRHLHCSLPARGDIRVQAFPQRKSRACGIDFMSRLTLPDAAGHYIYTVATYGTSTGGFTHMARSLFARKGWPLRATYSVRMVDVWTPLFNVSNREKCLKITQNAEPQIDTAIHGICRNASGNFASRSLPWWLARWQYALYDRRRSTRYFKVNSRCTGCGLCARLCPTGSISINDSRPEWTKPRCTLCLSCLHHCPMSAIENGKASHRHGRFLHPDEGQSHG